MSVPTTRIHICRPSEFHGTVKASVGMKVEITSIKQVHQLRDIVLSGDLDTCLNAAIAKMDPNCQELVVEKREFFDFYESTILSFTEFTPHQLERLS